MKKSRILKKYLRKVNDSLPASHKEKQKISEMINESLEAQISENPDKDITSILTEFGSPSDVAAAYINEMGISEILAGFRVRKKIIRTVSLFFLSLLLACCIYLLILYIDIHHAVRGYSTVTIETSEEIPITDEQFNEEMIRSQQETINDSN